MTDFGVRSTSTTDLKDYVDDLEDKLDTLHDDLEALHSLDGSVLVNNVVFNEAAETYSSAWKESDAYREFALLIDIGVTGSPTDIVIRAQFSDDESDHYNYMNGPFGDLRYEDAAGDKVEAVMGRVCAPFFRVHVISSGCDANNYFTVKIKVVLAK